MAAAVISYLAGGRLANVYRPAGSVETVRATPVDTLVSVTRTLGIAACETSTTVPERMLPDACAFRPAQRRSENARSTVIRKAHDAVGVIAGIPCSTSRFRLDFQILRFALAYDTRPI